MWGLQILETSRSFDSPPHVSQWVLNTQCDVKIEKKGKKKAGNKQTKKEKKKKKNNQYSAVRTESVTELPTAISAAQHNKAL